jgi:phage terminase small subunit
MPATADNQAEGKQKELTPKQKKFCEEWIFDFNGARSARAAGYSEDSIYSIASENLTKPEIKAYIKELQDNIAETAGISKLMVLREHQKLAFSSIAHLHNTWIERKEFDVLTDDQKACIQEISTQTRTEKGQKGQPDYEVEFVKIRLYDKQRSLDAINKMLGFNAPEKIEQSGTLKNLNYNTELTKEEVKKISDALENDV